MLKLKNSLLNKMSVQYEGSGGNKTLKIFFTTFIAIAIVVFQL
jgi:hypothetical protein